MSTTNTGNLSSSGISALGVYFNKKVINSLQPNLYFESLADVNMVEMGNFTDRFAIFNQIATASVTTLAEGAAPVGTAVSLQVLDVTPTQYGISVQMSDLVVLTTFVDLINETSREVGYAVARKIDVVIQTTANAGTQVIYPTGAVSRATITAGMLLDTSLILHANQLLQQGAAPQWPEAMYRAVGTVAQFYDLKANTAVGQWVDVRKYDQPNQIFNGELGAMHGVRLMQSPNVQTFASTVTVSPLLVAGPGGIRVSYWLPGRVRTYIIPPEMPSITNPLGQLGSVGAKVNMGASRTQEARLVRIETAATLL